MNNNTPHLILNIKPNASTNEINKAYHNLAKKYHPDEPMKCWELRRLCCIDETPTNT